MSEPDLSDERNGGTPLWVKIQGAFVLLLILTVIGMFSGVLSALLLPGGGAHLMPGGGH